MSTSLAKQLLSLQTPQTGQSAVTRRVSSILFDTQTAEELTIDKAFNLGVQGIRELQMISPRFREFEDLLFRESSKGIQRAVQNMDFNVRLDQQITKFLMMVSPHLLLKPALQALEWLVHRFQIGEYNATELIMCALPFHNTPTFCLVLRAIPEIRKENSSWHWLKPVVESGVPLDVHTVHKMAANQVSILRMIVQHTISSYKECVPGESGRLQTLYSFTTSVLLGVLVLKKQELSHNQLSCMVPLLHTGLTSTSSALLASCLAIVAHLAATFPLADTLTNEIITHLTLVKLDTLRHEAFSVLVLLFTSQTRLLGRSPKLTSFVVTKMAALPTFPETIAQIQAKNPKLNLSPFLIPLFETAIGDCRQENVFTCKGVDKLIISLLENLMMPTGQAEIVISFFLENLPNLRKKGAVTWLSSVFKMLESRYPSILDAQIKKLTSKDAVLKECYHIILTHQGLEAEDGVMTMQGLCHQMLHPEDSIRASAVRTAGKMMKTLSEEDKVVLQSCLKDRLKDDSMAVVCAVLTLKQFSKIITKKENLLDALLKLLEYANQNKWNSKALAYLVTHIGNSVTEYIPEEVELNTALHVLPHILANPSLYAGFSETQIFSNSVIFGELKNEMSGKTPGNVVLLSAMHEVMKGRTFEALDAVEKRLECTFLTSLDMYLLCLVLEGVAANAVSAAHRMKCCQMALSIKSRAKFSFPKKAQTLATQYSDLVKNKQLPIDAFSRVILALVQKPMRSFLDEVAKNVQDSVGILKFKSSDDSSEDYESCPDYKWCGLIKAEGGDDEYLKLSMTVMSILLELYPKFEHSDVEHPHAAALKTFIMLNFSALEGQLHFLSQMWSQPELQIEDRLRAIMFATSILKLHAQAKTDILQLHPENCFVPAIFCALSHPEEFVRQTATKLLVEVAKLKPVSPAKSYHPLLQYLCQQTDEISQHEDQLGVALFSVLTEDKSVQNAILKTNKKLMQASRKCLFAHCMSSYTPRPVTHALLRSLRYVKTQECLTMLIPLADSIIASYSEKSAADEDSFEILNYILERIDETTAQTFLASKEGWKCYGDILKSQLTYSDKAISISAVDIVNKEMFNSLESGMQFQLVHLLLTADNRSNLKAVVASALRKLPLDGDLVASELKKMVGETEKPEAATRRRTTRLGGISAAAAAAKATGTLDWAQGTVMLEALPEKKKMEDAHLVVPVLFDILKLCLESEDDQEYVKQLSLSSLNTLLSLIQAKGVSCQVDIELIVNSLKASSNPRTQRETLVLLCHTAHLVPDNLMHHLVSVFTFMGSLVLRHDDEYSLQIITKVIEDVVPVIIKSKGNVAGLTNILRVFSDALPDIPSHRRPLIFDHLMATVGWDHLWLLLVLVFESETYIKQTNKRLECLLELTKTCKLPVLLKMLHKVFQYLSVFIEIEYGNEKQVSNAVEVKMILKRLTSVSLTDPCSKPASEVRKFQIMALDFLSKLLSIKPSTNEGLQPTEKLSAELESLYKALMDCLMSYLLIVSQKEAKHKLQSKFWSCLLLQGYSVLNKLNMLLPLAQFVAVVQGVLTNPEALNSVKSKTLELLGAKLQLITKAAESETKELTPLVAVCQKLAFDEDSIISCKALFCMRLLVSILGTEGLQAHKEQLQNLMQGLLSLAWKLLKETNHPVMANVLLCLAELATVLRLQMLESLQRLMPTILAASKQARQPGEERSEIVLLASLAVQQRLLENLPQFLSPYLQSIMEEVSQMAVIGSDDVSSKAYVSLQHRIKKIQSLLSSKIALRVLLTPLHGSFVSLSKDSQTLSAVGPLMSIIKARFDNMQSSEIPNHVPELTTFFLEVLELRCKWDTKRSEDEDEDMTGMNLAEEQVISALVTFVLKLQEPIFKPFFFKLYKWSKEAEQDLAHRSRCITFYRLVTSFADKLKGLFTVFVPIYMKQAAQLLQSCHQNSEDSFFGPNGQDQTVVLLQWLLQSLLQVFTHDRQRFVKQDTFDLVMQPLVDQLDNMQGGEEALLERGRKLVGPCLAQFAKCMQDDVLWKQLHYQILLKTRSNHPKVRLVTIEAIQTLAEVLREDLLPLLPEAIPFIAELMEDEDPEVEKQTQHVSRELEKILGEPLDKYF